MNKRTKFQLRNIELFARKYVFNSKYMIRNILAATILMTLIATGTGIGSVVANMPKKEKAPKVEKTVATVETEEVAVLNIVATPELSDELISSLRAGLEENMLVAIEPKETEIVSNGKNGFESKFVAIEDNVNVRAESNTEAEIVGKVNDGVVGDIISVDGEWIEIKSGSIEGFIKSEFVLSGDKAYEYAKDFKIITASVNDDGVNVRSEANKDADIVETAYEGTKYIVLDEDIDAENNEKEWICVEVVNGKGYINSDYIDVEVTYPVASALDEDKEENKEDTIDDADDEDDAQPEEPSQPDTPNEPEEPSQPEEPEQPNEPEEPSIITRDSISLTDEEVLLMAAVVTLESGGECYDGQLAVANVIINRLISGAWGSSVSDVIYAPGQFSCVNSDKFSEYVSTGGQSSCIKAVREAAAGTNNVANYKSFRPVRNVDVNSLGSYVIIGNHVFF